MDKTIYCIWNDTELIYREGHDPAHVILTTAHWSELQNISRTGVKKFKPTQKGQAKAFAQAQRTRLAS